MAKLKVPSLQHLARNWRGDSGRVCKTLVKLVQNPPSFNYHPLFGAIRDMLVLRVEYEQIVEGIRRGVKRPDVRDNFLEVLPLIRDHFNGVSPTFVQAVERRLYPVARGLMVPFDPPLVYGVGGQTHFPWFSFWRQNPLADERLSLFVTIVEEVLLQDPDLESAKFEILDFSAPQPKKPRELTVIDARDIPRVSETTKNAMLSVFADGYFLAEKILESARATEASEDAGKSEVSPDQADLFGENHE